MTFSPAGNNPSFTIASSNCGLTIGADTATNIQLTGTAKTLNIATTQSNTDLNIGTGARTLAVVHNYSDGDNAVAGSNVHLNNGVSNLSNTAIHNGTNSIGNINIGNGSGSSTTINIGNETAGNTSNYINGNTVISKPFSNSLQATGVSSTVTLYSSLTSGNMTFGAGQTSGQLDIGNRIDRTGSINIGNGSQQISTITIGNETTGNTNTYLNGNTIISKPQINTLQATTTGSSVFLYSSLQGGNLSFATGQTSGQLEIGSQASRSGAINIGTGASATSLITIGSTSTNTTMLGTTKINTLQTTSTATNAFVYGNLVEGSILMGANQTSGPIQIGSSTSRTGAVQIANATQGDISIGAGMLTAGTNNINIGTQNLGKTGIKASNVYLNETGTGAINFGNSTTTAITQYKPTTVAYSYPASTPSQIGWTQGIETGFSLTFDTAARCNACNTTAMVQGIYAIKFFIYSPNGNIPSGANLLCVLMGSNTSKANGTLVSAGGVIDPNGGTYGWYLERKISGTTWSIDTTINFTFIINNTNSGGSQFLPFMFIVANASTGTSAGNMVSATFTRLA